MREVSNGSNRLVIQKVPKSDWSVVTLYNARVLLWSMLMDPEGVRRAENNIGGC